MVAYIASETLTHSEIVPEDEQGANFWDILTQRPATRQARQTGAFWDAAEENVEDEDQEYGYDDDQEETITAPSRRWPRPNILDDEEEEYEEEEPFNTHCLLLRRTQNLTTSPEHCPGAKKGRPQLPEREHLPAPTFGPASAWLRTKAGLLRLIPNRPPRKSQQRLVAEEPGEPVKERHVAEQGACVVNADRPQAGTFTSSRPHWTVNYTMRKWFLKVVVLQDRVIFTHWFTSNNWCTIQHHSKYFVPHTNDCCGQRLFHIPFLQKRHLRKHLLIVEFTLCHCKTYTSLLNKGKCAGPECSWTSSYFLSARHVNSSFHWTALTSVVSSIQHLVSCLWKKT